MPQKVLKFTGINRRVNEFQAAGACEELINIRPTAVGAQIVRNKKSINDNANRYKSIVEHKFGSTTNFIATTENSVLWVSENGEVKQTLLESTAKSVVSAGNILTVVIDESQQVSFKFIYDRYEDFTVGIPSVKLSVELRDFTASEYAEKYDTNADGADKALSSAMSMFYKTYPHGLAGPIIVGCTFELEDGNEVWSTGFSIIDPTKDNNFKSINNGVTGVTVYGAATANLNFNVENFNNVSGIKNIKLYSSLPQNPYSIDRVTDINYYYPRRMTNTEMNLCGQPMFLQRTLPFKQSGSITLDTRASIAGNELMPVTSGPINRTGDIVSYNNRFHYYNSEVTHTLQKASYGVHSDRKLPEESNYVDIRNAVLYVVIDNGRERIFVSNPQQIQVQIGETMDFVYPMAGIKEGYLRTYKDDGSSSWYKIEFHDSEAYNYSYALDCILSTTCEPPVIENHIEAHGQSIFLREEVNAINVSAPYNPFVFPVSYSYSFGGKILDVVTSYLPISSTQIGQYPLTVFTDNGIFALSQGDGNVLYGNVVPLQPMVINGQAKATPHGIFFFSSKNLYVLVGRDATDISIALKGKRELGLRDLSIYKTIAHAFIGGENALSVMDFEEYAEGAVLAYDQLNNELYISNPALPQNVYYSYVFNLDTKVFHKSNKYYIQDKNSYRYALQQEANRSVVDMHTEEEVTQAVFLQSRPFSLEVFYTHIQRLIMQIDANITGHQKLGLFVFASDNLHDWKCIISAQKQETVLRHIRTNRAAKSYKDYVIILSGTVSTDTDISDLIADYTVVSRRLG